MTIQNCFQHCGFRLASDEVKISQPDDSPSEADSARLLDELQSRGVVPPDVAMAEYAGVDDDLATSGTMTDAEIAAHVTAESHDEEAEADEEEECTVVCPTAAECRLAIETIKTFFYVQVEFHVSSVRDRSPGRYFCVRKLSRGSSKSLIFSKSKNNKRKRATV